VSALQGRAAGGTADQLLPALRPGSHRATLSGVRERAGARLEVLRHLRTGCRFGVSAPARPPAALIGLGAWLANPPELALSSEARS
jgi:hypothetical protein